MDRGLPKHQRLWRPAGGFTLIELVITVALALIVLSIGVPSMSDLMARNLRTVTVNELVGAVQYARGEAIRLGREVVLCPSDDGLSCADRDAPWSGGYLVFVDEPRGPPYELTAPSHRRATGAWPPNIAVSANRAAFVFRPLARRSTNGTFELCHSHRPIEPRAVIIAPSGRPRASRRRADGQAIVCPVSSP